MTAVLNAASSAAPLHCAVHGCGVSELGTELILHDGRWLCSTHLLEASAPDPVASPAPSSDSPSPLTTNASAPLDVEPPASESPQPPSPQSKAGAVAGAGAGSIPSTERESREAELDIYLRQHAAGDLSPLLAPLEVDLPPLPARATPAMRAIYDDFRLVRGLMLAACDDRPVAYGAEWVAARLGIGKATVSRARAQLVQAGVLRFVDELPARGKGNGTKTYVPGDGRPLTTAPNLRLIDGGDR